MRVGVEAVVFDCVFGDLDYGDVFADTAGIMYIKTAFPCEAETMGYGVQLENGAATMIPLEQRVRYLDVEVRE